MICKLLAAQHRCKAGVLFIFIKSRCNRHSIVHCNIGSIASWYKQIYFMTFSNLEDIPWVNNVLLLLFLFLLLLLLLLMMMFVLSVRLLFFFFYLTLT